MEDRTRNFCMPIEDKNRVFSDSVLKKATKINWITKVVLWFVKSKYEVDNVENTTLQYKMFNGRIYIIGHFRTPPHGYNCRHKLIPIT